MAQFDIGIIITAVNNAKNAINSVNQGLDQTEKKASAAHNKLRAIQVVLASIALGAGVRFAKSITHTVGEMELLVERMKRLEGGTKAAMSEINLLTNVFAKTPFAIDKVADAFSRFREAGLSTEEANKGIKATADAVAAFGGSTAEFERAIIGMQQTLGKGTVSMQDFRQQIGQAIPSALKVLAREYNTSVAGIFSKIQSGSLDSYEALQKLFHGFEKAYGGTAEQLGGKILGTIQGAAAKIRLALYNALDIKTDAGKQIVEFVDRMKDAILKFIASINQQQVDSFFAALGTGADIVMNLVGTVKTLFDLFTNLFNLFDGFLGGSSGSTIATAGIIGYMMFGAKGAAIFALAQSVQQIFGDFIDKGNAVKGSVSDMLNNIGTAGSYGLMGYAIFGSAGPAALVALVGLTLNKIGANIAENKASHQLLANFQARVVAAAGENGPAYAKKFLETMVKQIDNTSISTRIAQHLLGQSGDIQAARAKAEQLLKALKDPLSDFYKQVDAAQKAAQNKASSVHDILNVATEKVSVDIAKLANQAETTTFSFGSTAAEKMKRKLETFLPVVKQLQDKINEFIKNAAGAPLSDEQKRILDDAKKELASMQANVQRVNDAIAKGTAKAREEFQTRVTHAFNSADNALRRLAARFGKKDQDGLTSQIDNVNISVDAAIEKFKKVGEQMAKLGDTKGIAAVNAKIAEANSLRDQEITKLKEVFAMHQKILNIAEKQAQLQAQQGINAAKQLTRGPAATVFQSQFVDQAAQQKLQLQGQLLNIQSQIVQKEIEAKDATGEHAAEIQNTIGKLKQFQGATEAALKSTNATGLLATQTWQSVGAAIKGSAGDALKGLIEGTGNARDVLLSFYSKITDAAINYLLELVKIKIEQQLLGSVSGGTGGSTAGGASGGSFFSSIFSSIGSFFGGAANGATVPGGVRMFRQGGLIQGPTMFGMAGEAGTEAIMPLTRVGGDLGVKVKQQGGGDQYHITIQAIDTVSGMQFIHKHAENLVQSLRAQGRLNNSPGSTF